MKFKDYLLRRTLWVANLVGCLVFVQDATSEVVDLEFKPGHTVLLAGKQQTEYIKIGLTGMELERETERPAANIAIVLDKSGSMTGDKIRQAKEAAILALDRLSKRDIVSVITYDTTVNVALPATKASDKEAIRAAIRSIEAGGNTALHAGVTKGAEEVRKFLQKGQVNRIILLSDGLANVGPDSPDELGRLGTDLNENGIAVTTIGLGLDYNEDLMFQLAKQSGGNHFFAEEADDLARLFDRELGTVLAVVAQNGEIRIRCGEGVRPVRVLGRDARIDGRDVFVSIDQIHSEHEKYAIVEVEVPATSAGASRKLADVEVSYDNLQSEQQERLEAEINVRFSDSEQAVQDSVNKDVMVAAVELIATERNLLAVKMRDEGKIEAARELLNSNAGFLRSNAAALSAPRLEEYGAANEAQGGRLSGEDWTGARKEMREQQYHNIHQ